MTNKTKKALWLRILELFKDGAWHTPVEIRAELKLHAETEITARIRDLRKHGHEVECRIVDDAYRYRLVTPGNNQENAA